jgi:exopolyphosphatase/guanosine-5'-triphosphate,3'-diphosphate pyrophosphatase
MQIFDQLQPRLPLPTDSGTDSGRFRQILEAAAMLHDVGYLINYASHHKHSYHLIVHADLPGWTSREVHLIANIARYHRCAAPSRKHASFAMLTRAERQAVRVLAAILRIADGLDRTHVQRVDAVRVQVRRDAAFFEVSAAEEPSVDLWGAARKGGLFERAIGLIPHFEWRQVSSEISGNRKFASV